MCGTDYSFGNMITAYHELGHVQYFMQYAHQPGVYRGGANRKAKIKNKSEYGKLKED